MVVVDPDERASAGILSIPISLNWRHPLIGLPSAHILRVAQKDERGRVGAVVLRTTVVADHGKLPVVSLYLPHGALFDPDTGLMVVGNAIFHAPEKLLNVEYHDPRWWKYPGNFHLRGKAWGREGIVQLIGHNGQEIFQSHAEVRINGQMTRGFPQHALRLTFPEAVHEDIFGEPIKQGYRSVVLRAAGNDQIKAMMRDAFQHELCRALPFEVSGHRTCVVYINGAYWGVHHIRPRMDEMEIARRYDIPTESIAILEDEGRPYRGDKGEVSRFWKIIDRTREWDGADPAWMDSLSAKVDIDGFLSYMATQMIFANVDWPGQNVKFWRYTGKPRNERPLDGRWYFIMGDSDLGFGVQDPATSDMFNRVNTVDVPITWLFRGLLQRPEMRERFVAIARSIASGPLSAKASAQELERFVALMGPEMDLHTARWRRPADSGVWMDHVQVMRRFAEDREGNVLRQLDRFENSSE